MRFDVDHFSLYVPWPDRLGAHARLPLDPSGDLTITAATVAHALPQGTRHRRRRRGPTSPPRLDHAFDALAHYGKVNGTPQAGAVTFFGFLSFFPILALGFFFIGCSPRRTRPPGHVRAEVANVLPGIIGNDEGEIPLSTFERYAGTVGLLGLLGLLYAGLGWLSGMRSALG